MSVSSTGSAPTMLGSDVRQGLRETVPVILPVAIFGALFGAAAVAQGIAPIEAMFASLTMFAGASQFVFLEINGLGVPAWSVVLAVFAVNFRHILYSAAIGRRIARFSFVQKVAAFFLLTDLQFAVTEARGEKTKVTPAYYFAFGIPLYFLWAASTAVGVLFGSLIENPDAFGFDLLLPIYFLTILMGFRARPLWLVIVLASGVASVILLQLIGPPWHISLGALIGIGLAAFLHKPEEVSDNER